MSYHFNLSSFTLNIFVPMYCRVMFAAVHICNIITEPYSYRKKPRKRVYVIGLQQA